MKPNGVEKTTLFARVISLKGEFEAEGLTQQEVAHEFAYACKEHIGYIIKIGGAEARSDILFAKHLGITQIVAPMIESSFAMTKYMKAIPDESFQHVGVTIETLTAVTNIEAILNAGTKLTHVTIGRSDLTASYKGEDVDGDVTMEMVRVVVEAAHCRNLQVTLGGGVNTKTQKILQDDPALAQCIACVETRKAVIPMDTFLHDDEALRTALSIERNFLDSQARDAKVIVDASEDRSQNLARRLG